MDEIVVTRDVLKAIGADTRIEILKALDERQKTQSELASQLKLAAPTVLEHLEHLAHAGLVEKLEEGRKWKYYKLTKTGKKIVNKTPVNVVMLLGVSIMFALAALLLISQKAAFFVSAPEAPMVSTSPAAMITSEKAAETDAMTEKESTEPSRVAYSIGDRENALSAMPAPDSNNSQNKVISLENKTIDKSNSISNVENQNILPELLVLVIAVFAAGFSIGYMIRKN